MATFECSREAETIRAAWSGRWPDGCDPGLVQHAAGCRLCSQAVEFATVFRAERESACEQARVPPAGLVWWKAQLRARNHAAEAASRPILLAQVVALVSVLGVTLVIFARLFAPARAAIDRALSLLSRPGLPALDASVLTQPGILLLCATALLLAPVALYLALARD